MRLKCNKLIQRGNMIFKILIFSSIYFFIKKIIQKIISKKIQKIIKNS